MVETHLCKLRGTSDTFLGRALPTVSSYEYGHFIGDISAVCSVYATSYNSWYPLLLVLTLVFDGGIHNDREFQFFLVLKWYMQPVVIFSIRRYWCLTEVFTITLGFKWYFL